MTTKHFTEFNPTRWPRPGVLYGAGIEHLFGSGPGMHGGLENAGFTVTASAGIVRSLTDFTEQITMDNSGGGEAMTLTAVQAMPGFTGAVPLHLSVNIYTVGFGLTEVGSMYQVKIDPQDETNEYSCQISTSNGHMLTDIIHGTTVVAQGDATALEPRRTIIAAGDRQEYLTAGGCQSYSGYETESIIGSWNCGSAGAVGVIMRMYGPATMPLSQARKSSYKSTGGALAESENYRLVLTFSVPAGIVQTFHLLSISAIWQVDRFDEQSHVICGVKRVGC